MSSSLSLQLTPLHATSRACHATDSETLFTVYSNLFLTDFDFSLRPSHLTDSVGDDALHAFLWGASRAAQSSGVTNVEALPSGGSLLVHGGSSGIGTAAIQMARLLSDAQSVVTTAGSDEKCALCVKLGASAAINYRTGASFVSGGGERGGVEEVAAGREAVEEAAAVAAAAATAASKGGSKARPAPPPFASAHAALSLDRADAVLDMVGPVQLFSNSFFANDKSPTSASPQLTLPRRRTALQVGAKYTDANLRLLNPGGTLCVIGLLGGHRAPSVDLSRVMTRRLRVTGSTLRPRPPEFKAAVGRALLDRLWPKIGAARYGIGGEEVASLPSSSSDHASACYHPQIDSCFDFTAAGAAAAHERMESSEHAGKILLTV